mgnify:CR=1 FL=1
MTAVTDRLGVQHRAQDRQVAALGAQGVDLPQQLLAQELHRLRALELGPRQEIEGFGACFNELGWTALAAWSSRRAGASVPLVLWYTTSAIAAALMLEPDLIIDTHGQPIIDPVYELFEWTIQQMDPVPVLLERDYNFEDLEQIQSELMQLRSIIQRHWRVPYEAK